MVYILLAWLIPLVIIFILIFTVDEGDLTVRDALQFGGLGLIPVLNWVLLCIIVNDLIKESDKIQEFLNRKLK